VTSDPAQSDIDRLRAAHPRWDITDASVTRASGPDARSLVASREGIQVRAWDAAGLSAKIAAEEIANGWPARES
jgi:hypothetical protein